MTVILVLSGLALLVVALRPNRAADTGTAVERRAARPAARAWSDHVGGGAAVPTVVGAMLGLALLLVTADPGLAPFGPIAGGFAGRVASRRRARRREDDAQRALARPLADALELLAAAVDGGAPLEGSLTAVARFVEAPLDAALARAAAAAAGPAGVPLGASLRAEGPALRGLAALVGAAEELGTPVAGALRALARDERERERRRAREAGAAAAPKMMLLVGTLLAPAALILVVAGQVLTLLHGMGGAP